MGVFTLPNGPSSQASGRSVWLSWQQQFPSSTLQMTNDVLRQQIRIELFACAKPCTRSLLSWSY